MDFDAQAEAVPPIAPWPRLDSAVELDPSISDRKLASLWDRFEVFEALHHTQEICNPMRSEHLDRVVDAVAATAGESVLDIGCGSGELLVRMCERAEIVGVGLDASPWMLNAAAARARARVPGAELRWRLVELTDDRSRGASTPADVVCCIGAEWIWHGVAGTIEAVAARCPTGGRVVVGLPRLHADAAADRALGSGHGRTRARPPGRIETCDDIEALLAANGLKPATRIDPTDADWDTYLADTAADAAAWAVRFPGERAESWLDEQRDWAAARERDRSLIGWSAWVAKRP